MTLTKRERILVAALAAPPVAGRTLADLTFACGLTGYVMRGLLYRLASTDMVALQEGDLWALTPRGREAAAEEGLSPTEGVAP